MEQNYRGNATRLSAASNKYQPECSYGHVTCVCVCVLGNAERAGVWREDGGVKVVWGCEHRGLFREAHSSSHYERWLLWYFCLSISGGGGGWGEIPQGGVGASAVPPPCAASSSSFLDVPALLLLWQLTFWLLLLPLLPPFHQTVFHFICPFYYIFYLWPILSLPLPTHTHTQTRSILPPHSQYFLHSLPFYISPGRQPLTLWCPLHAKNYYWHFNLKVFFSHCSLLMPYSRRTFTCQWARQRKRQSLPAPVSLRCYLTMLIHTF